jgi:hypothetical protein
MIYANARGLYRFTLDEFDALHRRAKEAGRITKEQIAFEGIKPFKKFAPENIDLTGSRK